MDEKQANLQSMVERLSWIGFDSPFTGQVKFNKQLTTTAGYYYPRDHHLEINERLFTEEYDDVVIRVILHLLVHYHLDLAGQDYRDRSAAFKEELQRVQGLGCYTEVYNVQIIESLYYCPQCDLYYSRMLRSRNRYYRCSNCRKKLQPVKNCQIKAK
ncbi:SprT family protein [Lactobacillus sp. ESL0791]|uniref:SprT family protein n=1 Tax=Lactobacillus sp. ESL0791 TaxID=2983234 RepID=UPI0023F831E3|nr:SprT family protein [Lactobacillus sp. ESL0791]MDF7639319.1 SprT family protein [Lactobacillus sp. ESL0791]